jgi:hypothetical protein
VSWFSSADLKATAHSYSDLPALSLVLVFILKPFDKCVDLTPGSRQRVGAGLDCSLVFQLSVADRNALLKHRVLSSASESVSLGFDRCLSEAYVFNVRREGRTGLPSNQSSLSSPISLSGYATSMRSEFTPSDRSRYVSQKALGLQEENAL